MKAREILTAQSDPQQELDRILAKCCEMVLNGQESDNEFYGMVGACVVCPGGELVYGVNYEAEDGRRVHAERAALERCANVTPDCIIVTTLSPCNRPMDERSGESCEDLIAEYGIEHVYCGYKDPTQDHDDSIETDNPKLRELCKKLADTFLKKQAPGVAEGVPQPGESSGAPKKFGPDAKIEPRQMTAAQIIKSIPGVPYYNNVVDDWDAKDYSWGVTKKVIEYATYLKDHPESLSQLPPILVLNGKFEDGAHRVSAIWLLQQRMDPQNPLWANAKLNVQLVEQGVAEGIDIGQEWMSDTELDQYVPDQLQQQWRELLGYDRNGNPSALWVNLTGGYEPDVRDPEHRALMVKVANKWFAAKKIPNVKFYDVKDADDELEWLVQIGSQDVAENFADGKNPGRKGLAKRSGVNTKASVTSLRNTARHSTGEKQRMAHWLANMKAGRAKARKK